MIQAFCGSIQSIEMQEGQKAIVTFEKPSAASTALMLNGEQWNFEDGVLEETDSVYVCVRNTQAELSTDPPSRSRVRSSPTTTHPSLATTTSTVISHKSPSPGSLLSSHTSGYAS
jgi:hypothetical protein